jgi:hypothetical protein
MARIFISYRRQDSAYVAATLSDKLQQHFGTDSVFFDVDNIPLGVDFRDYIGDAVGECDVLLVMIGDQWLDSSDAHGRRRIDDPADFVRIEIEAAFKRKIPIVPILVGDAVLPAPENLPESVRGIVFRNAAEIRAGRDLRQHIERIIVGLETIGLKPFSDQRAVSQILVGQAKLRASPRLPAPEDDRTRMLSEIRRLLDDTQDSSLYVGEAIPQAKLTSALTTYAPSVSRTDVLLLYDNTVFGGSKDGLLLTSSAIHWHNMYEPPKQCLYSEIESVEHEALLGATKLLVNGEKIFFNMEHHARTAQALANVLRGLSQKG